MTDVLIPGLGAVTCHGRGVEALWGAMNAALPRLPVSARPTTSSISGWARGMTRPPQQPNITR